MTVSATSSEIGAPPFSGPAITINRGFIIRVDIVNNKSEKSRKLAKAVPIWLGTCREQHDSRIASDAFLDTVGFEKPIQDKSLQIVDPPNLFSPGAVENPLQIRTWPRLQKFVEFAIPKIQPQGQPSAVLECRFVRHESRKSGDHVRVTFV